MKRQNFKRLISLAQQERAPSVDVTDGVISTLSTLSRQQTDPYRAYVWASALSVAAAACILVAVTMFRQGQTDSVNEIISYVSWVAQ